MKQKDEILYHFRQGKTLTPTEALSLHGSFRLAAVVYDLKKDGHNIKTRMVEVDTRHGKTSVAEYRLAKVGVTERMF